MEGDTVVVFGAGPVGLYAAKSAWLMGAGRVLRAVPEGSTVRLETRTGAYIHAGEPLTGCCCGRGR